MLRLVLPGMLMMVCATWVCAETVQWGKQIYSNRPVGYTVPTPYYGTPMTPRFIAPVPYRTTVVRVAHPAPQIVAPEPALPELAPPVPGPYSLGASQLPVPQVVKETIILQQSPPETSVNDELDAFYARLAKIQLEKHQLDKALALVQNIKSETFKVRTVVDLAEYVSRDKSYRNEAEQLYRLAIDGMAAIDRRQPFRIDSGNLQGVSQQPALLDKPAVVVPPTVVEPDPAQRQPEPVVETPIIKPELLDNTAGKNGRQPDPPKTENNGLVTVPSVDLTIPQESTVLPPKQVPVPVPLDDVEVSPPDSSSHSEQDFVRPSPTVRLDAEAKESDTPLETLVPPKSPEVKPRPLRPIILPQEN